VAFQGDRVKLDSIRSGGALELIFQKPRDKKTKLLKKKEKKDETPKFGFDCGGCP
jgi:hypothetical protein